MALSHSMKLLVAITWLTTIAFAELRTYNFTVGWVNRNPDGLYERPVMGINGQWPIPTIYADVGDQVVVNLKNDLGDRPCSLHFHGLYMNGTTHMDGVAQTSQCPIPAGSSFTYAFNVSQPGTYWYHSHVDGQYPDGLRGPLIVHDPENPYADQFDEELVLTLSDWYHDEMPGLIKKFLSVTNPTGAEPGMWKLSKARFPPLTFASAKFRSDERHTRSPDPRGAEQDLLHSHHQHGRLRCTILLDRRS